MTKTTVTIPEGSSTQQIAAILDGKRVIKDATLFRLYLRVKGGGSSFQAGDYDFPAHLSMGKVASILKKGPTVAFNRLTIPEGFTLREIADQVGRLPGRSADKFLAAAASGTVHSAYQPAGSTNLEGLLFPDTYFVDPRDDEATILRRMVAEFDKRRKVVVAGLNKLPGISCATPKGAFYAFPNVKRTGWKAKALASALLEDAGVALIGGPDFGILGEGYMRVSYANSTDNILKALNRIGEFLASRKAA